MTIRCIIGLAAAAMAFGCAMLPASAECLLKSGDRVVFLGDDVTESRMYQRCLADYLAARYPHLDIAFRFAGLTHDTTGAAVGRLEEEVLSLEPTVVTILYGINEGDRRPFEQARYDLFIANLTRLVTTLSGKGVRILLLTPTCVDPVTMPNGAAYNDCLGRFGTGVQALAARYNLPCYDLHGLMMGVQERAQSENPRFGMIKADLTPDWGGHAVIAYALAKALGCTGPISTVQIDAGNQTAKTVNCTVENLGIRENNVEFVRTDLAAPARLPAEAEESLAMKYVPFQEDLNRYELSVTGLKPGDWTVRVEGLDVGVFSSDQLAKGANFALRPGPWRAVGAEVDGGIVSEQALAAKSWNVLIHEKLPAAANAERLALIQKTDSIVTAKEREVRRLAGSGHPWKWSLTWQPGRK